MVSYLQSFMSKFWQKIYEIICDPGTTLNTLFNKPTNYKYSSSFDFRNLSHDLGFDKHPILKSIGHNKFYNS